MTYVSINLFLCFSLSYLLKVMCDALLKQGDPISMKKRFALVTTFLAMGRTGELSCATWDSAEWDFELNNLMFYWNELKTSDSDITNMFSDSGFLELDWYHSLACFAILGGDVSDVRSAVENKYMVPSLAVNKSGAAKVITNWVRSTLAACEKKYSVLAEGYEGTGIR